MSELGREELLRQLSMWLIGCKHDTEIIYEDCKKCPSKKICKQASRQIKALIQKPGVTEEWIEKKARELLPSIGYKVHGEYLKSHIEIAKNFIRSLVEEMPAKKATVDKELISKYAEWFREDFERGFCSRNNYKGRLKQFSQEAGLEVVKK